MTYHKEGLNLSLQWQNNLHYGKVKSNFKIGKIVSFYTDTIRWWKIERPNRFEVNLIFLITCNLTSKLYFILLIFRYVNSSSNICSLHILYQWDKEGNGWIYQTLHGVSSLSSLCEPIGFWSQTIFLCLHVYSIIRYLAHSNLQNSRLVSCAINVGETLSNTTSLPQP